MSSTWEALCDAVEVDLTASVPELSGAIFHKLAPWDPDELITSVAERHVAVWPEGDTPETSDPFTTGGVLLGQSYVLLVWEPTSAEDTRLQVDYQDAQAFMELQESVRARILSWTPTPLVTGTLCRYGGTRFVQTATPTRWFASSFTISTALDY